MLMYQQHQSNDNQIQNKQPSGESSSGGGRNVEKQVILNDIAAGLANAVAVAVADAVSSVHQQMNNQENNRRMIEQQQLQQQQQQLPQIPVAPVVEEVQVLQLPPRNQHFSHLRQQLESKNPHNSHNNQILRKRLTNINIEAAVATAVNNYLTTTIKNNQKLTRNQLDQDENVIVVDDIGKRLIKNQI